MNNQDLYRKLKALGLLHGILGGGVAATYTISGTVYDADGSTAVASATVALGAYSATSAVDGTYTISDVPAGTSGSMTCTKAGYSWTAISVSAMAGNLTSQNYTNAWWAAGGCAASCVAAYQPIGAASQAASYINLANPGTNNAAPGTAPAWDSTNGWKFTSSSSHFLTTGLTIASGWSVLVRFSSVSTSDATTLLGANDGASHEVALYPNFTTGDFVKWKFGGSTLDQVAGRMTSGVLGFVGADLYKNGSDVANSTGGVFPAVACDIGAQALSSGQQRYISAYIQAVSFYNATITGPQAVAVTNALNAL